MHINPHTTIYNLSDCYNNDDYNYDDDMMVMMTRTMTMTMMMTMMMMIINDDDDDDDDDDVGDDTTAAIFGLYSWRMIEFKTIKLKKTHKISNTIYQKSSNVRKGQLEGV